MSLITVIGTPLYQWETGRKLKIIPLRGMRVDSVHFSNYGDKTALVVKPREENGAYIADIPNILLQDDRSIAVYSVNVSEDKTETLRECVFSIQKRAKPSDYIYTETEVFTYKDLEARVKKLEEDPGEGDIPDDQIRELIGDLENLNTESKGNLVDAINEALLFDYADVTEAYESALSEGDVTCAREYLWALGEGRWSLVDGDEKYYLQAFLGGFSEEPPNHSKRILIRCWEFLDIEIHSGGGGRYDADPYLMLEGETGAIRRYGDICNPTDLYMLDGKVYLSQGGFRFGKGVELPKEITEDRVYEMISEALGGIENGAY